VPTHEAGAAACPTETWKLGWDEIIRFDVKEFETHHSLSADRQALFQYSIIPKIIQKPRGA
jgi:hypothetical protein